MQNDLLSVLAQLSDGDLVARMRALIARERESAAELVAHLAELDTRELYLKEGYGSLYVYCRDALGLSEWEAYNRIEVARSARRFPMILERLADGSLSLTACSGRTSRMRTTPRSWLPHMASGRQTSRPS